MKHSPNFVYGGGIFSISLTWFLCMPIHPTAHSFRPPVCVRYVNYALLWDSKNVCCDQGAHIKENPFIQAQYKHSLMIFIPCKFN